MYTKKQGCSLLVYIALCFFFLLPIKSDAATFLLPNDTDIVGELIQVPAQEGDTLLKIAQRFNIGRYEMLQANPGIRPTRLKIGQLITVPQLFILPPREYRRGIVINIPELRLYYFSPDGKQVSTFPVALGRAGWRTPTTTTSILKKKEKPNWNVPTSIKNYTYNKTGRWLPDVILPGPNNPLGEYAMYLGRRGYLIHGTNAPSSIGTLASSGCIRMYNADIEELFSEVSPGDPVTIINHAYKAGWHKTGWLTSTLYLEAHPSVSHNESITELNDTTAEKVIMQATFYQNASIDWAKVEKIAQKKTGIPQPIGPAS